MKQNESRSDAQDRALNSDFKTTKMVGTDTKRIELLDTKINKNIARRLRNQLEAKPDWSPGQSIS